MILHAEVNQKGILQAQLPNSFRGKKVVISIASEAEPATSNWAGIALALKNVDALPGSRRSHAEILNELRTLRETE
ncbi:MAG: hypothetical protein GY862_31495 [Gammaproteobacteria bacterium]|nr:hypothetical protein [Gammaproteobacteria bacterium]